MTTAGADIEIEVVVVGAGLMGAATAWELTRRGHSVAVVEALSVGHERGSSHGSTRIFRRAYHDPLYVALTGRARELWREAEHDTGVELLRLTGGLDFGRRRDPERLAGALFPARVAHEILPPKAAARRWPGFRFSGPVLFCDDAGVVLPERAIEAWLRRAKDRDAQIFEQTPLRRVDALPGGRALVITDGPTLLCDAVIVAAGPWLPELVPALSSVSLPPLKVTQQQAFHFASRDPGTSWPIFIYKDDVEIFGLPSAGETGPIPAVKVAETGRGTPTTASGRSGVVNEMSRRRVVDAVAAMLPGLDDHPLVEQTCLYTSTLTEDFILDRVGPVVIVSACSGHGAKFAPLVGEMAADLATTGTAPEPRFALATPLG